jgi:dynein light intermediate chain 1
MEEVMISWRDRGRGGNAFDGGVTTAEGDVSLPLGPGEWEEALGLPLCVVCQNASLSIPAWKAVTNEATVRSYGVT